MYIQILFINENLFHFDFYIYRQLLLIKLFIFHHNKICIQLFFNNFIFKFNIIVTFNILHVFLDKNVKTLKYFKQGNTKVIFL